MKTEDLPQEARIVIWYINQRNHFIILGWLYDEATGYTTKYIMVQIHAMLFEISSNEENPFVLCTKQADNDVVFLIQVYF